jgi:alpha-beta hydrolase superfamily lysophospholipase
MLGGCTQQTYLVSCKNTTNANADMFGYRKWISPMVKQDIIIIGIHGFCGASIDYSNLGNHLLKYQPETGLYAYEVRGQGSDPIDDRRGDIGDPEDWYSDLYAFTQLVQEQHPKAKIVWFGESMGGLIAANAWQQSPRYSPPCAGLILSSPIVRFRDDIPAWTPALVRVAGTTLPLARISMETLAGGKDVQMTQTSHHSEQVKSNSYNIEQYTLRLIGTLASHIDHMNECATHFNAPVLLLHGGNDYFNNDSDLRGFLDRIPAGVSKTYHNYPKAYHLLMYDAQRDLIFRDVERWTKLLRNKLGKKL